ncbi:divalent-cation tolerance protein CutA [Candidatus Rariloculus sp.]|uniref:divalent-cation tolerance protein CutA n=1 Tax=Candidatus Rariloculus sp. TaxID=3101265 RepID=UPI003D1079E2
MSADPLLVLTTCESSHQAHQLANVLVEGRLAACVNAVNNVSSTYRWAGKVERGQEFLLLIKTTADRFDAIEEQIKSHSSYELPEVMAVRIEAGSEDYLDWISASVRD